ncbi:MAG: hypothetical protein K8L97_34250 [Anaerolineae bacterium]|nr:hypothetical protein [Anaerolineae bacterium]
MFQEELILPGEHRLGEYQISIIRRIPTGWSPTVPPLDALVTNYRLLLKPQLRRPYPPASIPSSYITNVSEIDLGQKPGVKICLKTGHQIHMLISWSQASRLAEDIKAMLISPVGNIFIDKPIERDIKRLIRFVSQL